VSRFGAVARHLRARHQLRTLVTFGPGEQVLATAVVDAAGGAATLAPPTRISEIVSLMEGARLVVSGDTGPLHIAAAMGAPLVALFGPTWPARNGPWNPDDAVVSRAEMCKCHHKRQCLIGAPCIDSISVEEVTAAVDLRLARERASS
jgi:ADP-heptose:LPS heptosyltransferase